MSTDKNYSIEELEDAAVKKSNLAKTVGVIGAMSVGGVGAAYAANAALNSEESTESIVDEENVAAEDINAIGNVGSDSVEIDQPAVVQPAPPTEPEPEPDVQINSTDHIYVDGEEVATIQHGEVQGHEFAIIDNDNDKEADILWVDKNDNSIVDEGEVYDVKGEGIMLNTPTPENNNYYYNSEGDEIAGGEDPIIDEDHDDISDIHNDFDEGNERDDESYNDYAENNEDYQNNEDVDDYDEASVGFGGEADGFGNEPDGFAADSDYTGTDDVVDEVYG